jgi:hypothetical protein
MPAKSLSAPTVSTQDSTPTVEEIILRHGTRGIERIARYLPVDYAARAAEAVWANRDRVLIATGFNVQGRPETDGPSGAVLLGRALASQGSQIAFVGESDVLDLLKVLADQLWDGSAPAPDFLEFPIADTEVSRQHADRILQDWRPTAIVAIERCGCTCSGCYRNMLGADIVEQTAQVDALFLNTDVLTVAIGDGGNEIGMGTVSTHLGTEFGIEDPVATSVDYLIVAAVSNWGAYGLLAYLSRLAGEDLLPSDAEETRAEELMAMCGAVDGLTGKPAVSVDGFPLKATLNLLADLRGTTSDGK